MRKQNMYPWESSKAERKKDVLTVFACPKPFVDPHTVTPRPNAVTRTEAPVAPPTGGYRPRSRTTRPRRTSTADPYKRVAVVGFIRVPAVRRSNHSWRHLE